LTAMLSIAPFVRFAYRGPELHVAIEAACGVIGALAAFLFCTRFLRSRRRSDLALAWSLGIFAFANLFLSAVPAAVAHGERSSFTTWAPIGARVLGTVAFAFAALDTARLARPRRALVLAAGIAAAAVTVVALVPLVAGSSLPAAVDASVSPETSTRPLVIGHPAVLAFQLLSLALFVVGAVGFARAAERTGDELLRWVAVGAVLAALARLNYFLFPSLYSDWVYTGDLFRFAFYAVLLVGAAREVADYWRAAAGAAVLDERRRLARDLHDGLAQELAFITARIAWLRHRSSFADELEAIENAAGRALGEARRAIAALTRPLDEPLGVVLAEVAEDVTERCGMQLELNIRAEPELAPEAREELLRIAREAIMNAARHSRASTVTVELSNAERLHLRVADDGVGFDLRALPPPSVNGGYGLVSMRERAVALGGELSIRSRPGAGTAVELVVP